MGLKPRDPTDGSGGGQNVVSSVTAEEMQAMAAEYADGYPSDEDMYEEAGEARKGKPNLATKLSSAVKNFSLPSPDDIMNSSFVKSFQQPLMVKSKVQSPKTLANYQATIAENSPATLSKINKLSDFPMPSMKKREKDESAKEECNGNAEPHEDFGYGTLRSLKETKLITKIVETDVNDEQTLRNMEITKTMSPSQLAEIKSFKDFPLPNVQMFKKSTQPKAVNGHAGDATDAGEDEEKKAFGEGFMNTKLMTNSKESDPDDAKIIARQELVKTKSPAQLASITSFSDFPVPAKIENLLKGSGTSGGAPSVDFSMSSLKDGHFTVPDSLKMELQTNATVEDEEIMTKNRELVNSKSVAQLSQIHSFAEFPIPEVIENLMNKKQATGKESDSMVMTKSNLSLANLTSSNILPASLRETKLITNVKEEKDHEKLLARQNLIKSKTPMELSQIKDWGEFPIPAKFQNLQIPTLKRSMPETDAVVDSPTAPPRQKSCNNSIYESLPSSLRNEVIVRSRPITDEELKIRQEIIRSKSPTELSQISSLKDIPVPRTIEKLFEKGEAAEGKEKEGDYDFIEKYSTMPSSLKANLLVGAKVQDQTLVQERQEVLKSKSVSELSEIKSFSDLPIPATLQRMAKKDRGEYAPVERKKLFKMQMKSQSSQSINQQHQPGTLPRSLKEQHLLMVKSKIEAPDVLASRRSLVETKSVAELSKVTSLADVPVPTFLSRLASASLNRLHSLSTGHLNESSAVDGESMGRPTSGIYSALPSLNTELLVGKSVQDLSKVEERRHLVNSKSVSELSQVKSFKEFPVPDAVQRFCAKSMERLNGTAPAGEPGDSDGSFFHIPSMLTQPCIVTTKIEDPQKLLEHQQIQQQKSVHELSKIRNLNELPVPGNLFQLPDVPIPKAKDLLKLVARPPRKAKTLPSPSLSERQPDSQLDNISNFESCSQIEEEATYSHLEDSYEIIEKEEVYVDTYQSEEAADEFGLASQVKGTPERNTRSNKKKKPDPRNRRSHEDREEAVSPTVETPPPLPPKRSPHKQMSVESVEEGSNLPSPTPVKGVLTLEAMNGNVQVNQMHSAPEIQARPLPTPPAPVRYNRTKHSMERQLQAQQQQQGVVKSSTTSSMDRTLIVDESVNFQTCRDTMMTTQSRTLMVSDDDNTMADSIVESLVSCTDTLICDDDATDENDDDPYPSVNFESGMSEILDDAIMQPPQTGERRLEEGTAQLSEELMNHVESLRNTLDNMSNRLGARSRSRSSSKPRSGSRPRPGSILQEKMHE